MSILHENRTRIMHVCSVYAASRDDREDLFQEIAIQIWRSLPHFRGEASLSTWIYRIALNIAMRFQEKQHRSNAALRSAEAWFTYDESTPDEALDERIEHLRHCIHNLPERQRNVVVLFMEDCSQREIAATLELSESNVGVMLSRIKPVLLKCMNALTKHYTSTIANQHNAAKGGT